MNRTIEIELNNGLSDDNRETCYVVIHHGQFSWTLFVAIENNARGYSFADAGGDEALFGDAGYWCAAAQDAIKQILLGQYEHGGEGCGVEDIDGFLAGEGKWLANLSADDFAPDKWTERGN